MTSRQHNFEGYERMKGIGKGAFGTAVLYRRISDNKEVVIKEIFLSDMTDSEKQLAFNEANVLKSLNHPNIIRYMGSFEREGSLFIEMEYANNGNLTQLINLRRERKRMFKERDILDIFSQITAALSYMHSHKILHRDLKTANIFLRKTGIIKIGDFGISKVLTTRKAQAQTVVGTPYYLSPEMCEGKEYDEKSDVWAVGCILYELTCFRKPFEAPNLPALVQRISTCEYDEIPDVYSNNLSQLVRSILQKDYNKRPSGQEIHDKVIPNMLQSPNSNNSNRRHSSTSIESRRCAAGEGFSVFINETGLVFTCGDGRQGCLGHSNWNSILRPTIIDSLITKNIIDIKCGSKHVVALTDDGKVYSWGSSSEGQLGLSHEKFCCTPTPIQFSSEYFITNIFTGPNSSALLDSSGRVLVCGDNTYNKLGVQNENKLLNFKLLRILRDKIVQVSLGVTHTILITQNGKVMGMGRNNEGQLGIGNCTTYSYPQTARVPQNITMVSCQATYTIARTDNNVVYFWGTHYKNKSELKHVPNDQASYNKSILPHKTCTSLQKISEGFSAMDKSTGVNTTVELIKKPKSVLALHASNERLKAGHMIWLDDIYALQHGSMILVHTTAPPPLRKTYSEDSTHSSNQTNNTIIPDWMDTNLEYSAVTTLPNTTQIYK